MKFIVLLVINSITIMTTENQIFRFKFSDEFNSQLLSFSKLHQHDERKTYKDNWTNWISNNEFVENESIRLRQLGYNGNVLDKMYKSGRYYFRNKTPKKEPKQRRVYISIDSDIIESMDIYLLHAVSQENFKPSTNFEIYKHINEELIKVETERFTIMGLNKTDIENKLKKTFKNRHFLLINQNNDNNSEISEK